MENSAHATATGAFVLLLTVLLGAGGYWLAGGTMRGVPYDLVTESSVAGLSTGAPILLLGVDVGEVQRITFDPLNPRRVRVRALIHGNVHLLQGTEATVSYLGLSGTAYVELEFPPGASEPLISSAAKPARIPMQASGFDQLVGDGRGLIKTINETLKRVNTLLAPQTVRNASLLIGHLNQAAAGVSRLTYDLQPAARDADGTIKNLNRLLGSMRSTLRNADTLMVSANERGGAMDAIRTGALRTGQAAREVEWALVYQTLPQIDALTQRLSRTSDSLDQLLQQVQSEPQSLVFGMPAAAPGPGERGFKWTVKK